jgi:hypothetical protein
MAGPLTIDNYDVAVHERWAKDQEVLEPLLIQESGSIPAHFDIAALEKSLLTKWEQLFELDSQRHAFAHFAPPPKYTIMRNRFFSHAISEQFDWAEEEDDEEEQKREDERRAKQLKELIKETKAGSMPKPLFEKERKALVGMIDSIHLLNGLMREIHAKKLQYQKG